MIRKSKWQGWNGWTIPAFALTCVISLIPWVIMIYNSFFDTSFSKVTSGKFVGLDNYRQAFSDPAFLTSIWNTTKIILVALPLEFIVGLGLAVIVWKHLKMRKFVVPILMIPMIIAPSVVGLLWNLNLNPIFGPIGILLRQIGISPDGVLANIDSALLSITLIDVWQWTPFMFLLFLSGLCGLPREPLEAAAVNNASSWQTFWRIILPALKPIMIVGILLRFTDLYKIFDTIWTTTVGGPGLSTETLSVFGYRVNFLYWHKGYGSAVVFVIYLISYIACLIFFHTVVKPEKKLIIRKRRLDHVAKA